VAAEEKEGVRGEGGRRADYIYFHPRHEALEKKEGGGGNRDAERSIFHRLVAEDGLEEREGRIVPVFFFFFSGGGRKRERENFKCATAECHGQGKGKEHLNFSLTSPAGGNTKGGEGRHGTPSSARSGIEKKKGGEGEKGRNLLVFSHDDNALAEEEERKEDDHEIEGADRKHRLKEGEKEGGKRNISSRAKKEGRRKPYGLPYPAQRLKDKGRKKQGPCRNGQAPEEKKSIALVDLIEIGSEKKKRASGRTWLFFSVFPYATGAKKKKGKEETRG